MMVHVVNLERFPERRERVEAMLGYFGVEFEIFSAIDGLDTANKLLDHYDEDRCLNYLGVPLQPGEVGCFASHFSLWRLCVEKGAPIVVMEDDVEVYPQFSTAIEVASERIEEKRFIRLSGLVERKYRVVEQIDETWQLVRFLRGPVGTQCYCISPEGAAALLEGAESWGEPVDRYIDRFWQHGVDSLGLLPFTVAHDDQDLTIGERWLRPSGRHKGRREISRITDRMGRFIYNARHLRS